MSLVVIRPASYEYGTVRARFFEIMETIAGDLVQKDGRVLIKPNLLTAADPDKAVTTHPLLVRAAVEYVLSRGAHPTVSDSPAAGSFRKVAKQCGIEDALRGLDVECREFSASRGVDTGEPFGVVDLAEDALDADVVINLPKFKTHSQMVLTMAVKNLFGCVVGIRKPEWHLRMGTDHKMFARLLLTIFDAIRPAVSIMDAVWGMEGQGPGSGGVPRHVGVLMGSRDGVALDMTACRMIGLEPLQLPTIRAAQQKGLMPEDIVVDGELPSVRSFRLPEQDPLISFVPPAFHRLLRRHLLQRPVCEDEACRSCGQCWQYCPAGAIRHSDERIEFDYEACIRCYCCIEVCPHGALKARDPLVGRMIRKIVSIRSAG